MPPPLRPNEARIETIHRYKGLDTPATVLIEVAPDPKADLRTLVRIGLHRAQTYAAILLTPAVRDVLATGVLSEGVGQLRYSLTGL